MKASVVYTIIGVLLGSLAGWLYWHYIGCNSGGCVITSKPVNSTLYGGLLGGLLFNAGSAFLKSAKQTGDD